MRLLLLAFAGAVGTLARYGFVTLMAPVALRVGLPLGTLGVNVLGSFAAGAIASAAARRLPPESQTVLVVGFLGAFTTFSALELDVLRMLDDGKSMRGFAYAVGSLALGLAAALAGRSLALRFLA